MRALERLMKGRTVITIAHRLSTIRNSDKILVLKDGVVAEQGTHDELMNLGGEYAELYRVQFEARQEPRHHNLCIRCASCWCRLTPSRPFVSNSGSINVTFFNCFARRFGKANPRGHQ